MHNGPTKLHDNYAWDSLLCIISTGRRFGNAAAYKSARIPARETSALNTRTLHLCGAGLLPFVTRRGDGARGRKYRKNGAAVRFLFLLPRAEARRGMTCRGTLRAEKWRGGNVVVFPSSRGTACCGAVSAIFRKIAVSICTASRECSEHRKLRDHPNCACRISIFLLRRDSSFDVNS